MLRKVGGTQLTALKVTDVVGTLNMITRPRNLMVPELVRRRTLQQHQDHLVDVDDHIAAPDEIQEPGLLGLGAVLNVVSGLGVRIRDSPT